MQSFRIAAAAAWACVAMAGWAQTPASPPPPAANAQPAAASAPAAVAAPTATDYARPPQYSQVVVSPDGRHMAVIMRSPQGKQRDVLGVVPLVPPGPVKLLANYEDAEVTWVAWVNNQRVVYDASAVGAVIKEDAAGTVAVDIDGSNERS